MRTIAFLIVVAQILFLAPLYLIYGQVDPCRALAKEIATRAEAAGGLGVAVEDAFGNLEINARRDIADHSTGACVGKLFSSWTERVTGT
ncbi:MAG: hypothetical protein K8S25_12435 [Alphaproteobacteria bacterium]|nr:hypothetical protein [Alphaproteobacteria bacterium]